MMRQMLSKDQFILTDKGFRFMFLAGTCGNCVIFYKMFLRQSEP